MNDLDQRMRSYLLGELSEAETTALEQEYFVNPQLFELLVQTESDLVDQYARSQLSRETRERFQQSYLANPSRRERARFAQALATRIDRVESTAPSASLRPESSSGRLLSSWLGPKLAWGLSLSVLLLVATVIWFAAQTRRPHEELARTKAEQAKQEQRVYDLQLELAAERTRADQLQDELNQVRSEQRPAATSNPSTPALATLILVISGVRGAETGPPATLSIPAATENVRIQLNLKDNDYSSYTVLVQAADGKQVYESDGLRSRNKMRASLTIIIPATKLSGGDYILTLRGVTPRGDLEDVSKSLFRVTRNHR